MPGPGGHHGGGPGMGRMGGMGHRPPPPPRYDRGWGGGMGRPPRRGGCGCLLPVMAIAVMAVAGIAMLLF